MHIGKTDDNKQIAVHNLQKQNNLLGSIFRSTRFNINSLINPTTLGLYANNNVKLCDDRLPKHEVA